MSPYIQREALRVAMAKVIRGATDPDRVIELLREAGYSTIQIESHLQDVMDREFNRRVAFLDFERAT